MDARKRDPRTWGLCGSALVCLSRAVAYLGADTIKPVGLDVLTQALPVWVFSLLWLGAGVMCVWSAFTGRRTPAFITLPALPAIVWGLGYITAQILVPTPTAPWAAGVLYLLFAEFIVCFGLVHPQQPRTEVKAEWTPAG
jgi:hypothetical protein